MMSDTVTSTPPEAPDVIQIAIQKGANFDHPRTRVLFLAKVTEAFCKQIGTDPAEGTIMLLTAATYIAMRHIKLTGNLENTLADGLGNAIIAAKDFFK